MTLRYLGKSIVFTIIIHASLENLVAKIASSVWIA